ncbi:MAG: DinB family protein [Bacteroidetes bacterium]|nr:DinB family protein [Bacteroidota bacterium]
MKLSGIVAKAITSLTELRSLMGILTDEQYTRKIEFLNGSSIGEHSRHILEMYQELLSGYESGVVCYENRQRDKSLETIKDLVLSRSETISKELNKPDLLLTIEQSFISNGIQTFRIETNYYRELIYNIEHTVHHLALIRVAVKELGIEAELSPGFGYADSTIIHRSSDSSH